MDMERVVLSAPPNQTGNLGVAFGSTACVGLFDCCSITGVVVLASGCAGGSGVGDIVPSSVSRVDPDVIVGMSDDPGPGPDEMN